MRRHKELFDSVVSFENLLCAARDTLRGKRNREPGASFFANLEKEIVDLQEELIAGTYRPGNYYYFEIREPKKRRIAAAPFRDRVVHHAVVRVIEPLFERRFIEDSFACRRGKGTHAAMRRAAAFAKRYRYGLKCDVEKYFASIDHDTLVSLLERVIGDRRLLSLLRKILDTHADEIRREWPPGGGLFDVCLRKRGLPIGNLTSQFFANVYLNRIDHYVKHKLRVRGYVRYLDDFVLFDDDRTRLRRWGNQITRELARLHLRMHVDKYRMVPTRCGIDFVGYVVRRDGRIRVRNATVRRFHRKFDRMRWEIRQGVLKPERVTESVAAWVAHVGHAQSYGLRRSVLSGRR